MYDLRIQLTFKFLIVPDVPLNFELKSSLPDSLEMTLQLFNMSYVSHANFRQRAHIFSQIMISQQRIFLTTRADIGILVFFYLRTFQQRPDHMKTLYLFVMCTVTAFCFHNSFFPCVHSGLQEGIRQHHAGYSWAGDLLQVLLWEEVRP